MKRRLLLITALLLLAGACATTQPQSTTCRYDKGNLWFYRWDYAPDGTLRGRIFYCENCYRYFFLPQGGGEEQEIPKPLPSLNQKSY